MRAVSRPVERLRPVARYFVKVPGGRSTSRKLIGLDGKILLAGTGVHAAHVAINIWIGDGGPPAFPTATPEQIAPLYWDLHERNHRSEVVFNG
ncbi:hypothetical protein ACFYO2_14240 [Streptomyces sp. NPDC006602]|uniref:hypothetical protein n=1 Tax=Streptomyces sp. NPDC006602 TaxID=3364751 RepID=UPI00368AB6F0